MEEKLFGELISYAGIDYEPEQDPFIMGLIDDAIEEVVLEMCPWGIDSDEKKKSIRNMALNTYYAKIKRIAQYHYDKHGKEGVVSWSGGGESATYESSGTPSSYLRGIIPISRIV